MHFLTFQVVRRVPQIKYLENLSRIVVISWDNNSKYYATIHLLHGMHINLLSVTIIDYCPRNITGLTSNVM